MLVAQSFLAAFTTPAHFSSLLWSLSAAMPFAANASAPQVTRLANAPRMIRSLLFIGPSFQKLVEREQRAAREPGDQQPHAARTSSVESGGECSRRCHAGITKADEKGRRDNE